MLKKKLLLQAIFISCIVPVAHGTATKEQNILAQIMHKEDELIVVIEGGSTADSNTKELSQAQTYETDPLLAQKPYSCWKNTGLVVGAATFYLVATAIVGGLLFGFFEFVQSREP